MSAHARLLSRLALVGLLTALLPTGARSDELAAGAALYATHCAACHEPLNHNALSDRTAKRIRSAINVFPVMFSLRSLTDAELAAIAAVLVTTPAPIAHH